MDNESTRPMPLNSWDEWSTLREVVLGSATGFKDHQQDLSFELFYYDNLTNDNKQRGLYPRMGTSGSDRTQHRIDPRYVEELEEDVAGMAEVLTAQGVTVRRPLDLAGDTRIQGLGWSSNALPALNIRDNTLIVGDTIVETPPMLRSRFFESQMLSNVFLRYQDLGGRWYVMPRPLMTDASFDRSYVDSQVGIVETTTGAVQSPYDVGIEAMFDAAQCLRLGRDVLANISTKNHARAVDWLERHFEGRVRFHRVFNLTDSHVDSMILPLKPGVFLVRHAGVRDKLPEVFRSWKFIVGPDPDLAQFPTYSDLDVMLSSAYIDLNVLSIDEERVLVNRDMPALAKVLEQEGFTPIPVRHRHRRLFGGGLHCFTLDTVRDGGPEDYLG